MHPQGLCVLLLAAFTLLAVAEPRRRVGLGRRRRRRPAGGAGPDQGQPRRLRGRRGDRRRGLDRRAAAPPPLAALAGDRRPSSPCRCSLTARDLSTGWVRELIAARAARDGSRCWSPPGRCGPRRGDDDAALVRWLLAARRRLRRRLRRDPRRDPAHRPVARRRLRRRRHPGDPGPRRPRHPVPVPAGGARLGDRRRGRRGVWRAPASAPATASRRSGRACCAPSPA